VPLGLDALRAPGRPVLLVFTDPSCGPCNALMPDIGRWQREHAEELTITVLSQGSPAKNRPKATEHGLERLLLQPDREVALAYDCLATPTAVVVGVDGRIASRAAAGADAIRELVERTVGSPMRVLHAGARMPNVSLAELRDLDGEIVDLSDPRAATRMLLFWDPGCGFCRGMLASLQAWEANPPPGAPELVVISTGTPEANRAEGLSAPIVLDPSFDIGRSFGASGTPTAVLVDRDGRAVSDVAVGAPAVLELAAARAPRAQ
jgi:thiol-disulfide isomerase/thioredoxin